MSNEIYYLTRLDGGSGIYTMRKSVDSGWGIYEMRKIDSTISDEGGGGGGEVTYSWTLYLDIQWAGSFASLSWNTTPGNYAGGRVMTVTNPIYTHVKIIGITRPDDQYWKNAAGSYFGSMGVKTQISYSKIGSGSVQPSVAAAKADWLTGTAIATLGSDRKYAVGFHESAGSKYCTYRVYYGHVI
jgi:hypothetical protein